jgi:hypothetical protein
MLLILWLVASKEKEITKGKFLSNSHWNRTIRTCQRLVMVSGHGFSLQGNVQNSKQRSIQRTSKALWDSFSIHTIEWSVVALQDRTMCSNRPSTGTADLTSGGYRPHLHGIKMSLGWKQQSNESKVIFRCEFHTYKASSPRYDIAAQEYKASLGPWASFLPQCMCLSYIGSTAYKANCSESWKRSKKRQDSYKRQFFGRFLCVRTGCEEVKW